MMKTIEQHLVKVQTLPCHDNGASGNPFHVYRVVDYDAAFLRQIVDYSHDMFGETGVNLWSLVPQIRRGSVYLLKREDGAPIMGLATFFRDWNDETQVYLHDYSVARACHGKGFGFYFLKAIIGHLESQGFKSMKLTVDVNNVPAVKLYNKKLGFTTVSREDDEYGVGEHRYVMELHFGVKSI